MKIIGKNKWAYHQYTILETLEAGMVLKGTEVKSLREGRVNFKESYCRFLDSELYLIGANISPYSHARFFNHDPERPRKLLLHRRQLNRLRSKVQEKGLTLVPLTLYFNEKGYAKVEIGLGRGKHTFDKREDLKKKTIQREIERTLHARE